MKNHIVSKNIFNVINYITQFVFLQGLTKIRLGLHLVLVTILGWFIIILEQGKWNR